MRISTHTARESCDNIEKPFDTRLPDFYSHNSRKLWLQSFPIFFFFPPINHAKHPTFFHSLFLFLPLPSYFPIFFSLFLCEPPSTSPITYASPRNKSPLSTLNPPTPLNHSLSSPQPYHTPRINSIFSPFISIPPPHIHTQKPSPPPPSKSKNTPRPHRPQGVHSNSSNYLQISILSSRGLTLHL